VEICAANLLGRCWVNVLITVLLFVFDELAARKCISRTLSLHLTQFVGFQQVTLPSAPYLAVADTIFIRLLH
jgi:hypothetical protein